MGGTTQIVNALAPVNFYLGGNDVMDVTSTGPIVNTGYALQGAIKARVNTLTVSTSTYTPACNTTDIALITSPTGNFTVANPTGTPNDGQNLEIRIKSGGTGFSPSWGTNYLSGGNATLPTTALPSSKTVTLYFEYDASAARWILEMYNNTGY